MVVQPKMRGKPGSSRHWCEVVTLGSQASSVTLEGSLAMKAQHWREYLITDLSVSKVTDKSSKSVKRRQHVRSVGKAVIQYSGSTPIHIWQDRDYPPGELPTCISLFIALPVVITT